MKILSTLSTIASAVPKPPLSILRFGSLAAGASPCYGWPPSGIGCRCQGI
jgi:hypothetical protein